MTVKQIDTPLTRQHEEKKRLVAEHSGEIGYRSTELHLGGATPEEIVRAQIAYMDRVIAEAGKPPVPAEKIFEIADQLLRYGGELLRIADERAAEEGTPE